MLLDREDTIVLTDFGIALMAQSSRYQSTQEVAGTAAYMAPEQFQGKPRRASDQYALGVVVYEWLSGNRPFHGSFTEIASQHLFVSPPPLRRKVPTISPAVEQVVLKALEKDPHQRFDSVQSFATALRRASHTTATRPAALSPKISLSKQSRSETHTVAASLSDLSSPPMNAVTHPDQLSQPTAAKPLHTSDVLPRAKRASFPFRGSLNIPEFEDVQRGVSARKRQFSKYHLALRFTLIFLIALLVMGGGLAWLMISHLSTTQFASTRTSITTTATPASITITATPVEVAPVLLSPPNGTFFTGPSHTTTLQWASVPNAVGYTVDIYSCLKYSLRFIFNLTVCLTV